MTAQPPVMRMIHVYDHPSDHPDHWVVRAALIYPGRVVMDNQAFLCPSLDLARDQVQVMLPGASICPIVHPSDDSVIQETWW